MSWDQLSRALTEISKSHGGGPIYYNKVWRLIHGKVKPTNIEERALRELTKYEVESYTDEE